MNSIIILMEPIIITQALKNYKISVITVIESLDKFLFNYAPKDEILVSSFTGKFSQIHTMLLGVTTKLYIDYFMPSFMDDNMIATNNLNY